MASDEFRTKDFGWFAHLQRDMTNEDGSVEGGVMYPIGVMTDDSGKRVFADEQQHGHLEVDFTGFNALVNADTGAVVHCGSLMMNIPDDITKKHGLTSIDMWIDDEGALKDDKSVNTAASVFAGTLIYGNVLIVGSNAEGEIIPLPFSIMLYLQSVCKGLNRDVRTGANERVNEFMELLKKRHREWMEETNGSGFKVTVFDNSNGGGA